MRIPAFPTGHMHSTRRVIGTSAALLGVSAYMLFVHATAVRDMRETGLPAAVRLADMRERSEILAAQEEIAELQATLYGRADEEYVRLYVLPAEQETERLVGLLDQFFQKLRGQGQLVGSPALTVGEMQKMPDVTITPLTITAELTTDGLRDTLTLVELSGLLTIADVLTHNSVDELLAITEQERPDVVSVLEHFLSLDLLRYAEKPEVYREQLLTAFEVPGSREVIEAVLQESSLSSTEAFLSRYNSVLNSTGLWPTRFLMVSSASIDQMDDRIKLTMTVHAYGRVE